MWDHPGGLTTPHRRPGAPRGRVLLRNTRFTAEPLPPLCGHWSALLSVGADAPQKGGPLEPIYLAVAVLSRRGLTGGAALILGRACVIFLAAPEDALDQIAEGVFPAPSRWLGKRLTVVPVSVAWSSSTSSPAPCPLTAALPGLSGLCLRMLTNGPRGFFGGTPGSPAWSLLSRPVPLKRCSSGPAPACVDRNGGLGVRAPTTRSEMSSAAPPRARGQRRRRGPQVLPDLQPSRTPSSGRPCLRAPARARAIDR